MDIGFFNNLSGILGGVVTLLGLLFTIFKIYEKNIYAKITKARLENIRESFYKVVKGLSSNNPSEKIASAILLRRFFNPESEFAVEATKKNNVPYSDETINVLAGLLRYEKTSDFQKILGDGLSFAQNLNEADLQRTNLQNVYLSRKGLSLIKTDFFGADLSRASLKNVNAEGAIFYEARLENTVFVGTNLKKANFSNANLLNANFGGANLEGANFFGAVNIPTYILDNLDENGIFYKEKPNTNYKSNNKSVFISVQNILTLEQKTKYDYIITKLRKMNINISSICRDNYQYFGITSEIKRKIQSSNGVICFGFTDTLIESGISRPHTSESTNITNINYLSPWIHIEIGLTIGSSKPLFLLYEKDLNTGVFEESCNEISFQKEILQNDIDKTLEDWINKL